MFRVRLIAVGTMIAASAALAACSNGSLSMPSTDWLSLPDWMKPTPPPPPMQALQFESTPPGADVRTSGGQTCRTPCSLAVPVTNQLITFAMNGFEPQTVPVQVGQNSDLLPNPVEAALQPIAPPPKPKARKKPAPKTARTTAAPAPAAAAPPPPPPANTLGDRFSPTTPAPPSSVFPPPPPPQH